MLTWVLVCGVVVVVISKIGDDGAAGGGEDVPRGVGNLYGMGSCWEGCCSALWVGLGLVGGRGRGRRGRSRLENEDAGRGWRKGWKSSVGGVSR